MKKAKKKGDRDLLFKVALLMVVCYFMYFAVLLANAYATFHEYSDFGLTVYGLYYNTQLPQIAHGLQLLTLGQHLSPDALFIAGIYYIVPSPVTLLVIQAAFIALTGLVILLIVKDLTKSSFMAFAFCLAFLINPGNLGLLLFDSHVEFLITLFYVLTVYYYLKGRFGGFVIASALLLGSADVTPYMALTLGVGLLLYEFLYNRKRHLTNSKVAHAVILIALSIAAIGLYSAATAALASSYKTSYLGLPQVLYVTNGGQKLIGPSLVGLLQNPVGQIGSQLGMYLTSYNVNLLYALLLVLLGFGLTLFVDPLVALVLIIPWLGGLFVIGNPAFLFPTTEYFGYVIGPTMIAALLGLLIISGRRDYLSRLFKGLGLDVNRTVKVAVIALPLLFCVVGPAIYLLVYSPASVYHSVNTGNIGQLLLFQSNATETAAYAQLDSAIAQVPPNVSVLTDYFIIAHLSNRPEVESLGAGAYVFQPDYILVDLNRNISTNVCNAQLDNCTELNEVLGTGSYSTYFTNGTAVVYKRNS